MKFIYNSRSSGKTLRIQKEVNKRMSSLKDYIIYVYDVDRKNSDEYLRILNNDYPIPNIDNHIILDNIVYTVKSIAFDYDKNSVYVFAKKRY